MSSHAQTGLSKPTLFVLLSSLYFSQGLPSGLLAHALPAIMREAGSSMTAISMLKLLALPWLFKFIWAPLLDKYYYAPLGPHRSWILGLQSLAITVLIVLAAMPGDWIFHQGIVLLFVLLLMLNICSASQDIATDGMAVKLLPKALRGYGNFIQVAGYKVGLMAGGAGLLIFMDQIGWSWSVTLIAIALVVMLIPISRFKEQTFLSSQAASSSENLSSENRWGFFKQAGIWRWLLVLALFKVADGISSTLVKPMLVDLEFSFAQIGSITFWASLISLAAALLVGWLYSKWQPYKVLLLFAVLQSISISSYAVIPALHHEAQMLAGGGLAVPQLVNDFAQVFVYQVYAIMIFDQMVDTMSTVVLFALMMNYCREHHEGGDYTLQACMQVFAAGLAGVLGGVLWDLTEQYQWVYLLAGSAAVLVLVLLMSVAIPGLNQKKTEADTIKVTSN